MHEVLSNKNQGRVYDRDLALSFRHVRLPYTHLRSQWHNATPHLPVKQHDHEWMKGLLGMMMVEED